MENIYRDITGFGSRYDELKYLEIKSEKRE